MKIIVLRLIINLLYTIGAQIKRELNMPDYRRLVSYIYNYEDGKKRNNVGYARIETRNGLCKCTLHITAPSLNDKQLKVYFFRRDNGGLDGIQIGTMAIRNGAGDLKVQTNSERIMNSPYSIEHMGGMVLYLSNSKFFATEWDDHPINMEVVSTLEKKKETVKVISKEAESVKVENDSELVAANIKANSENLEVKKENETDTVKGEEDTEPLEVVKEEAQALGENKELEAEAFEEKKVVEETSKENTEIEAESLEKADTQFSEVNKEIEPESLEEKNTEAEILNPNNKSDSDTIEAKNTKVSEKADINMNNLLKLATGFAEHINMKADNFAQQEEKAIKEDQTISSSQSEANVKPDDNDIAIRDEAPVTSAEAAIAPERDFERDKWEDGMTRKYYERGRGHNNIRNDREGERQDRREKITKPFFEDHPIAKYIYDNFERVNPFGDNEIVWCVKIEPQDIGLLPMEAWSLGNNSYLLHGYYSYRHLIFARVNDDREARYVLGVPGIYHNRERFMARMFGFENFKSVKEKDRRTGEFGYWYVPIMLN